ncbi:HDOD domain-containing protein [[Pseudomonas] boreopolis]|uniref:HDOD domain-containing protein n=1 Tax=Xanthomonas boreopolis TaxID=86183 RepID=UPI003DA149A1
MSPEIQAALASCRNLPSPPGVALRIIELAQDPDADVATAADAIALDMALSARMLRVANSPLYASRRRAENLGQALAILGLNATLSLALGFSMVHGLHNAFGPHPLHERVWRRSAVTALACRVLGQARGLRKPEELMLAGLLQDIGILALLKAMPDSYAPLLESATDNAALVAAERAALGCDHAEVGSWLAGEWNLPEYLRTAIARSEAPADPAEPFAACVALSGPVADIWLRDDPLEARGIAFARVKDALALDAERFEKVIEKIGESLPDIGALFDIRVPTPGHVEAIFEQARELASLRGLRELQDLADARRQADESENRVRHFAEQASRDALTGVYNRHQLHSRLEQEFEIAQRHGRPLSIAFIDLDDFKRVNDSHGHLVGDEVLRNFALALQGALRASDVIARYGGEEFLVILPNTTSAAAQAVLQRVLTATSRAPMARLADGPLHITFSAGLATQGDGWRFDDVEELLKAADKVLYRSKHRGRNQVNVHGAEPHAAQA